MEELEEGIERRGVGEAFAVDELVELVRFGYFVEGEGHDGGRGAKGMGDEWEGFNVGCTLRGKRMKSPHVETGYLP